MRKNTLISKIKALQDNKKNGTITADAIVPCLFLYLLAYNIEKSISDFKAEMLFNINSNNPSYTFIPAMVLICHYSKPPIRFYNSIL